MVLSYELQTKKLFAEELEQKLNSSILGLEDRLELWDHDCDVVFVAIPGTFCVTKRSEPAILNGAAAQTAILVQDSNGEPGHQSIHDSVVGDNVKDFGGISLDKQKLKDQPAQEKAEHSHHQGAPTLRTTVEKKDQATLKAPAQKKTEDSNESHHRGKSTPSTTVEKKELTLSSSNFKKWYTDAKPPKEMFELLQSLNFFLKQYCIKRGIAESKGTDFTKRLTNEAQEACEKQGISLEIERSIRLNHFAQRLWTSTTTLTLANRHEAELCFMINDSLRSDDGELLKHIVVLVRAINAINAANTFPRELPPGHWPPGGRCYRGTAMPREHTQFFQPEIMFRVPGFLATSFSETKARYFLERANKASVGTDPRQGVLFTVSVDPNGGSDPQKRCKHVTYVTSSNVPDEHEFLFAPYSVFTVRSAGWSATPGSDKLYEIHLEAALDNAKEIDWEDLRLASWY